LKLENKIEIVLALRFAAIFFFFLNLILISLKNGTYAIKPKLTLTASKFSTNVT
jgi:hypothetical protein